MPAKSDFLATAVLKHLTGQATWTAPATFYVCLCKVVPLHTDTGSTITEVAYTNYARQSIAANRWATVAADAISNLDAVTFPSCGATPDTALAWAICDAVSAGNLLYFGTLAAAVAVVLSDAPQIAIGALVVGEQ